MANTNESTDEGSFVNYNAMVKRKLQNGTYKIYTKRGRSKVWNIFGTIKNEENEALPNLVSCRSCVNVYKYNNRSTSNLIKHKCYILDSSLQASVDKLQVDSESKRKMVGICTLWCAVNSRPYRIVEDSWLKELIEFCITIGAKFGSSVDVDNLLPHPTTISRNITRVYQIYFKLEMSSIRDVGFGITSDLWTENFLKKTYIAVTIHFVKDGNLVKRLLGLKSMEAEKCTHENILRKVKTLLEEFNCELSTNTLVVTDRGSNMLAAFRNYNHIKCINHLINNVLQKSMQSIYEISDLCRLCSKLVKYIKKSGKNSFLPTTLKSYSPTRWNTYYYLFESIESNWMEIFKILEENNQIQRFDSINRSYIKLLLPLLKSFEEASKQLESDKHPTLHLSIIYIHKLKKTCTVNSADLTILKTFKESLNNYLESIIMDNLSIYHKIALFLFPPANELLQFSEEEKNQIKDNCRNLMSEYLSNGDNEENTAQIESQSNELFRDFVKCQSNFNPTQRVKREFDRYQNLDVAFATDLNVLQWWELHKNEFPLLYKVSCKILATPASSASSERVFSIARNLLSEKITLFSFDKESVNEIMFLNINVAENDLKNNILDLT